MGAVDSGIMGAALRYIGRRTGTANVTLVDEGGNVAIATEDSPAGRQMIAFIVDEYAAGEEPWDDEAYRECFEDLRSGGLSFDRGDVVQVTPASGNAGLLTLRPGVWPGDE